MWDQYGAVWRDVNSPGSQNWECRQDVTSVRSGTRATTPGMSPDSASPTGGSGAPACEWTRRCWRALRYRRPLTAEQPLAVPSGKQPLLAPHRPQEPKVRVAWWKQMPQMFPSGQRTRILPVVRGRPRRGRVLRAELRAEALHSGSVIETTRSWR